MEFYTSPGVSTELLNLWFAKVTAKDKVEEGGGLDGEHENIRIMEVDLEEAMAMIASGKIKDAKSIIGLQWLKQKKVKA
jgi:ADP-ribose pyrophosphatase